MYENVNRNREYASNTSEKKNTSKYRGTAKSNSPIGSGPLVILSF